jgi:peroxiredoxin
MTITTARVPALLLLVVACDGKGVLGDGKDTDGDGLSDEYEASIGTNPEAADTDHDTWDDRAEIDGNTDPMNGYDHPYRGGWPIDACRDQMEGSGNTIGQVAEDFSLMDQHYDGVRLHSFCDRVVVLVAAAQWCQPCMAEAPFMRHLYERYAAQGLMVITLLGEDVDGSTASDEDLLEWATTFGITHPVLQDVGFTVASRYNGNASTQLPSNTLLARGAVIEVTAVPELTEAQIEELLLP